MRVAFQPKPHSNAGGSYGLRADTAHLPARWPVFMLFEAKEITKRFGEVAANDAVSLDIRAGEIHALLGENGAGKSTLVKMMYGTLRPDHGQFFWQGEEISIDSPAQARALGIGMVFQHFSLFEALSVAENIALALPPTPLAPLKARIAEVSEAYGLPLDPDRSTHTLSVGEKQRVEIVRCLLQEPKLLIMDEPTSVLTPQEANRLFETLRQLKAEGCAVLYISHRLEEIKELCERATILRQGKRVADCDPRTKTARELAELMVGSEIGDVKKQASSTSGQPRLELTSLSLPARSSFETELKDISLTVHGGEIVGIAGVAGEGQAELMEALIGERRCPDPSMIRIEGQVAGTTGPTERRALGAAFVPEERNGHAAVTSMALSENTTLTEKVRSAFDVRAPSGDPHASSLSGGNLQKFVVGREILSNPAVFIVSQPTWGVDAGAAALIRNALVELAEKGSAILMISQDLEEVFAVSDRIAVIHRGELSDAYPASEMTPDRIGLLMGGAEPGHGAAA